MQKQKNRGHSNGNRALFLQLAGVVKKGAVERRLNWLKQLGEHKLLLLLLLLVSRKEGHAVFSLHAGNITRFGRVEVKDLAFFHFNLLAYRWR